MFYKILKYIKAGMFIEVTFLLLLACVWITNPESVSVNSQTSEEKDYIKWVDFNVSYEALCQAYEWDVKSHDTEHEVHWIELLAYTAAKTGGKFDSGALKTMNLIAEELALGKADMAELTADMKYYAYYLEA